MNRLITALLLCLPGALCAAPAAAPAQAARPAAAQASGGKMELFYEMMDGQGWQWYFLANTVRGQLKASELKVYPLVEKDADGKYAARRGETELAESRRVAVMGRSWPDKLNVYLNARSMSPSPDGWRDAALFAGLNPDEVQKKADAEGDAALAAALARASALGVSEAALVLDGRKFSGAQRLMPLFEAVNAALPADSRQKPPAGYKPQPKLPPPGLWVVLSSGIAKNDALVAVFDRYFEDIKPVVLDYKDAGAKFPWLEFVPSYVLQATADAKSKLEKEIEAGLFKDKGAYLVYEDRQRRGVFASRPAEKNKLEFFVMSQCPFGAMAENAVFGAEKDGLLPKDLKMVVHYIGDAKKDDKGAWTFSSLHGEAEWQEDARQLYIAKKYPEKFRDYLLELNKEYSGNDWEKAAVAAGISTAAVTAGFEEAKELLAADFEASSKLGMTTSPSFVLDGQQFMVGSGELSRFPGFEKLPAPGQPATGCGK